MLLYSGKAIALFRKNICHSVFRAHYKFFRKYKRFKINGPGKYLEQSKEIKQYLTELENFNVSVGVFFFTANAKVLSAKGDWALCLHPS